MPALISNASSHDCALIQPPPEPLSETLLKAHHWLIQKVGAQVVESLVAK